MTTKVTNEIKHVSDLDQQTAASLLQFMLSYADTKHFLGRRISEWVTAAPAMEATVAAANITQEELGHARSLFAMIRDIPDAPSELNTDTDLSRKEFYNPTYLNAPWSSWIELIAAFFLLDSTLTTVISAAEESSLLPLRQRVAKILQEEHFHSVYYRGWLGRIASASLGGRTKLAEALERVWPVAAAWLGPDDDSSLQPLFQAGILQSHMSTIKDKWQQQTNAFLNSHSLKSPEQAIDWSKWNVTRREIADE
ncbi:phenylacetate-CoA oxygenase subunit PaaI [candidate division KSB1 bacterium]|nr:phenylacetate-CoA oxygenase subunit PaaI [candidate division KSB1 bacterium]